MNLNRIKEILASEEEILVNYHGIPVWIESIETATSMALVSQRGTHDESRLVPIDGLEEI
ncbi:H-type small acid-soluble spore protein [Neobacillus niacini]|uniref:H-type small acid-soluble spore protein n=1 Tax=Neobacillus niacini TaxID=86668 RepID=UPI0021CB8B4C|nr:H-type small acid-soluble spore protein [Neobacillus niacini]MCM3764805.1 H-type small acid-soluble spore protein [Neobacillus niacini]